MFHHPHAKAVAAALVAVAYAGFVAWQAATGNGLQATDLFPVIAATGGAVLTYLVPTLPEFPHLKTVVAGVLQGVAALSVLFEGGQSTPNVIAVGIAVLGTLLVHKTVNKPSPTGEHEAAA